MILLSAPPPRSSPLRSSSSLYGRLEKQLQYYDFLKSLELSDDAIFSLISQPPPKTSSLLGSRIVPSFARS